MPEPTESPRHILPIKRIAALDLGTNSVRLAVADVMPDHTLQIVRESKEVIRLGAGEVDGNIAEDAIQRAEAACRSLTAAARQLGADSIIAVATSAVREAENRDDVVARLEAAAGADLKVISGVEEGRLIHLGVTHNEVLPKGRFVVVDIGGGSTELACGARNNPDVVESIKCGAVRTAGMFAPDEKGRYSKGRLSKMRDYVQNTGFLSFERLLEAGFVKMIGTSGTIENLVDILASRKGGKPGDARELRLADLSNLIRKMADMSHSQRSGLSGINPERADIIVPGAVILEQVMTGLKTDTLTLSRVTLRDGVLMDAVLRSDSARDAYGNTTVRDRSVRTLVRRFRGDWKHSETVARLAESIFDQSGELGWHEYGPEPRAILRYAAMMHDIGMMLNPSSHHKHGHYIITNSPLSGFHQEQIDAVAALVLFHRKSLPRPSHPVFTRLPAADQAMIKDLVTVLRLADSLDRTQTSAVQKVTLSEPSPDIALLLAFSAEPIPFETWAVERTLGGTPNLFGRRIVFERIAA